MTNKIETDKLTHRVEPLSTSKIELTSQLKTDTALEQATEPITEPITDRGDNVQPSEVKEIGGPKGLEPTRYGDWESKGRCHDF